MNARNRIFLHAIMAWAFAAFTGAGALAQESLAKLQVVATVPDLADFARQIGGDQVEVKTLARGVDDLHRVLMKPSFLLALKDADVFLQMGLDAEEAWLPSLLKQCRNRSIQPGQPGFVNCSYKVEALEVPEDLSRAQGMRHRLGNPHYNLDPRNGRRMVINVAAGLIRARPEQRDEFAGNLKRYVAKLDAKIREWDALARPLRGKKVVSYHRSFTYLAKRYGFVVRGEIETKPGIPPTPTHQASLIRLMRREEVRVILCESFYSDRVPSAIAEQTGAKVHTMPVLVGGVPEARDYIAMVDVSLKTLLRAFDLPLERRDE